MPEYWLTRRYPTGLENSFIVAWWDQRGAGLSYSSDVQAETMNVEQFVDDTNQVAHFLRERFGQQKIYMMGHSWGSYIGIQAAAKAPELYYAYIGVGQVTNQLRSERLAYEYALSYYEDVGDERMKRRLEAAPPSATALLPARYLALRDTYMHKAGIGTTREMKSVITGPFLPSLRFDEYTLMERVNLWRGKIFSKRFSLGIWDTMLASDLTEELSALAIPIYFLHGRYDYTCAHALAREYLASIRAPLKGFYTFPASAHSPMFEEPEKTVAILEEDVLKGRNRLADRED